MGWLSGWDKRIKLTIDKDVVDTANQTNFPVMVYLSAASGIGDVDVSCVFDELTQDANRKKIAVTSSDGTTELYVEIERWDDANEKAWLHVKVPSVAYDVDTILYLYYDSDHADNTTYVGDTTDAVTHNVWDASFKGVWHMAQDPNGDGADAIKDSTVNANDLTPAGTMLTEDLVDAKIGKGIDFDGTDDKAQLADISDFNSATGTISFIAKAALDDGNLHIPISFSNSTNSTRTELTWIFDFSAGDDRISSVLEMDGTKQWNFRTAVDYIDAYVGDWVHCTISHNGTTPSFYVDGDSMPGSFEDETDKTKWIADIIAATNTADIFSIGVNQRDILNNPFDGIVDEVCISSTARSAPWIKATYHSLWDSLITFGAEETNVFASCASLTITSYTVSLGINIDTTLASLTITPNASTVKYDPNILCNLATLTIAGQAATISWDLEVLAASAALAVATHDATIWEGATWAAWIAENNGKFSRKFIFTLTNSPGGAEISNGSFETGDPPSDWTEFDTPGVITVSRSSTKKYTGTYSCKIERTAYAAWGTNGQGVYQDVAIDGGATYSITGQLAVGSHPFDGVFGAVKIYEYAGEVSLGVVSLVAFNPSAGWQKYNSGEIIAGATATKIRIMLSTGPQYSPYTGIVYFDDFSLTNVSAPADIDDVEIPISSFQCRRRSAAPTYLSVVIPNTGYIDQINDRAYGDMKVEMIYKLYGEIIYQETIAIVDLEDIRVDEGGSNASISLIGHRTHTYTPKQITLRDIIYYRLSNGKYNFRCSVPDLFLAPGDTAVGDGNSFTVDEIQYIVSPEQQMMIVKET